MGTSKINIALGTPLGAKNPRNFNKPCLAIAIKVTSMKIKNDIAKVTIIWLVQVKLYGSIPSKFPNKININKEKINDKYFIPSFPILSPIMSAINSYDNSTNDWPLLGIIEEFFKPIDKKSILAKQ